MNKTPFLISSLSAAFCLSLSSFFVSVWNFLAFLSCAFSHGISPPVPSFSCISSSHSSPQNYSSVGAVAVQIKCRNPAAQGCVKTFCVYVCVHAWPFAEDWVFQDGPSRGLWPLHPTPPHYIIICSTAIIIILRLLLRSWDNFSAHSGKQQTEEGEGRGWARGESMLPSEEISFKKQWLQQRESKENGAKENGQLWMEIEGG